MKTSDTLALAFAISLACPIAAFATEEAVQPIQPHHPAVHHHHHHVPAKAVVVPAPIAAAAPIVVQPSAPAVENDSDGLSRDGEDCNKGCLDTTY